MYYCYRCFAIIFSICFAFSFRYNRLLPRKVLSNPCNFKSSHALNRISRCGLTPMDWEDLPFNFILPTAPEPVDCLENIEADQYRIPISDLQMVEKDVDISNYKLDDDDVVEENETEPVDDEVLVVTVQELERLWNIRAKIKWGLPSKTFDAKQALLLLDSDDELDEIQDFKDYFNFTSEHSEHLSKNDTEEQEGEEIPEDEKDAFWNKKKFRGRANQQKRAALRRLYYKLEDTDTLVGWADESVLMTPDVENQHFEGNIMTGTGTMLQSRLPADYDDHLLGEKLPEGFNWNSMALPGQPETDYNEVFPELYEYLQLPIGPAYHPPEERLEARIKKLLEEKQRKAGKQVIDYGNITTVARADTSTNLNLNNKTETMTTPLSSTNISTSVRIDKEGSSGGSADSIFSTMNATTTSSSISIGEKSPEELVVDTEASTAAEIDEFFRSFEDAYIPPPEYEEAALTTSANDENSRSGDVAGIHNSQGSSFSFKISDQIDITSRSSSLRKKEYKRFRQRESRKASKSKVTIETTDKHIPIFDVKSLPKIGDEIEEEEEEEEEEETIKDKVEEEEVPRFLGRLELKAIIDAEAEKRDNPEDSEDDDENANIQELGPEYANHVGYDVWSNYDPLLYEGADNMVWDEDIYMKQSVDHILRVTDEYLEDHLDTAERIDDMRHTQRLFTYMFTDAGEECLKEPIPDYFTPDKHRGVNYTDEIIEMKGKISLMPYIPPPHERFANESFSYNEDVIPMNRIGTVREQYNWLPREDLQPHIIEPSKAEQLKPVIDFVNHAAELQSTKDDIIIFNYLGPMGLLIGIRANLLYIAQQCYPNTVDLRLETPRLSDPSDWD